MILYYDHKRRGVFREDKGDQSIPLSMAEAKEAADAGLVTDCNLAFTRLVNCDFDMDAVEEEYRLEDKYK